MRRRNVIVITTVLIGLLGTVSFAQSKDTASKANIVNATDSLGFTVHGGWPVVREGAGEYLIKLLRAERDTGPVNEVRIFVAEQPFVYLPGTYGGRYYFNHDVHSRLGESRVPGDSVIVNGVGFKRDYWAVYAGQGEWETVINCYAYHDGQYYVISLGHDSMAGKPGEFVNGSRITKQQMRTRLFNSLRDTTNDYVRSFNQILGSFSLTK